MKRLKTKGNPKEENKYQNSYSSSSEESKDYVNPEDIELEE